MPYYRSVGHVPPKRHTRDAGPDGLPLFEELVGADGFSGESALLYHRNSPSALCGVVAIDADDPAATADRPMAPRHLRTGDLAPGGDAVRARHLLLANDDVRVSWVAARDASPLARNA